MPESDRDRFHGDVVYEVWRSGGNPDAVDYDCTESCYSDGIDAYGCASEELRRQNEATERRQADERAMQEQWEQEAYERQLERQAEEAAWEAEMMGKDYVYFDQHRMVQRVPEKAPTKGGAHAFYEVHPCDDGSGKTQQIHGLDFQHDTIPAVGVQGWTNEAVLAVVIDRLEGFQAGEFACEANQSALDACRSALLALELRTADRKTRGVEGKHEA